MVGILPDLLSWGVWVVYQFKDGFSLGKPNIAIVPGWVFTLYGITHSFFVMTIAFLLVYLIFKDIPLFLYAWTIHVLIDIPTHTSSFLPTPFLWPFSDYAFPGISWGNRYFLLVNYSLITIFMIYMYRDKINGFFVRINSRLS